MLEGLLKQHDVLRGKIPHTGAEQPMELKNMDGQTERFHCKLETILAFTTGAPLPPPCGFTPKPNIQYTQGNFPRANTCGNTLYLPIPTMPDPLPSYEEFCFKMVYGVLNAAGFQRVTHAFLFNIDLLI